MVFAVLVVAAIIVVVVISLNDKKKKKAEPKKEEGPKKQDGPTQPAAPGKDETQQWTLGDNWLVQQTDMGPDTVHLQDVQFWARETKTDPFRMKFSVARSGVTPHVNLFAQANEVPGLNQFAVRNIVGLKPQVITSKPPDYIKRTDVPALKSGAWMVSPNSEGNLVFTRGGVAILALHKIGSIITVRTNNAAPTLGTHAHWCSDSLDPRCAAAFGSGFSTDFSTAVPAGFMEVKNETLFINRRFAVGKVGIFYVIQGEMSTSLAAPRDNNAELRGVAYSSTVPSNLTVPADQKWPENFAQRNNWGFIRRPSPGQNERQSQFDDRGKKQEKKCTPDPHHKRRYRNCTDRQCYIRCKKHIYGSKGRVALLPSDANRCECWGFRSKQ